MGGMRGGLGIGVGVTLSPHQSHHMVNTCAAKSAWNPGNTPNKEFLRGGLMGVYWSR
jgi:hypothetical protein